MLINFNSTCKIIFAYFSGHTIDRLSLLAYVLDTVILNLKYTAAV